MNFKSLVAFLSVSALALSAGAQMPYDQCSMNMINKSREKGNEIYQIEQITQSIHALHGRDAGISTIGSGVGCLVGGAFAPISLGASLTLCAAGIAVDVTVNVADDTQKTPLEQKEVERLKNLAIERVKRELTIDSIALTAHVLEYGMPEQVRYMDSKDRYAAEAALRAYRGGRLDRDDRFAVAQNILNANEMTGLVPASEEELARVAEQVRNKFGACANGSMPTFEDIVKQFYANRGVDLTKAGK